MEIHRNCLLQVVGGWDNLSKCKESIWRQANPFGQKGG